MVFPVVLLASAFACNAQKDPEVPLAPQVMAPSQDLSDAADDLVRSVPTGAFADVAAFCSAQMKLIAPKIVEANTSFKNGGIAAAAAKPSCEETPDALAFTQVTLSAPYLEAKTVTFETGYSLETYLLVRASEGWTAVRAALLYSNHDDPGCGSIERPNAIKEVRVDRGALVITTASDREWSAEDENGTLDLTYARACRFGHGGVSCGTPEVINAKVAARDWTDREAPIHTRFFTTTFTVGTGVAIDPAVKFDEAAL
jgi:hypothetical protein